MNAEMRYAKGLERPSYQAATKAPQADEELDLVALLRTLWHGKIWLALAALLAGGLAFGYLEFVAVPKYTAQSTVAMENRKESVVSLDSVVSGLSGDQASVNTEVEVLRSRELIQKVVMKLGLVEDPEFNPYLDGDKGPVSSETAMSATVDKLLDALSVTNLRSSYVFRLSVVTTSAQKSADIVNTLAELYIQQQLSIKFDATAKATKWLSEKVAGLKGELQAAEKKAQAFDANTDLVSPQALEVLNRQIKDSRERLGTLTETSAHLAEKLKALLSAKARGDRQAMRAAANDVELDRIAEDHGTDAAFDARYAALVASTRNDLARTEAKAETLRASVVTQESIFDNQSKDLVTLEQLQREASAAGTIYEYFLSRLKETAAQEGIHQPDSRILSYAAVPIEPSAPRKGLVLATSVAAGLLAGAALILFRELLQSGYRSAEEIEQNTNATVLGQLPKVAKRSRGDVVNYVIENPTSAVAEAVRNLRTSLVLSNVDHPPQVILLTSSMPAEGKSTAAIALANTYAGLGKKVLLIEADLRRQVFEEYFRVDYSKGILGILSAETSIDEAVQRLEGPGIDVLVGEPTSSNAADIFASARFRKLIADLRQRYDVIIIDSPPVLLVPDARILSHLADAVLFTIKWDATPRGQVREALRQFETAGRSVAGIVLTQLDPKGMKRYGYGDRYSGYESYGPTA